MHLYSATHLRTMASKRHHLQTLSSALVHGHHRSATRVPRRAPLLPALRVGQASLVPRAMLATSQSFSATTSSLQQLIHPACPAALQAYQARQRQCALRLHPFRRSP